METEKKRTAEEVFKLFQEGRGLYLLIEKAHVEASIQFDHTVPGGLREHRNASIFLALAVLAEHLNVDVVIGE